ncbi:glycogen synthase GlgA [Rhodopila sp.]|uniref:glycogen synthase GlgA n=1 Tax=Rhodopila sp. TaxID=2480087 RepID=UPI002CBCF066|nr:glycogen synthase GlgA [Rhodopila sp.]HVZ07194.1 glycogen synthase GlgA [Rhodopila sp.]
MTRVLSVTSEIFPLVKTGGLADVTGALPGALAQLGVETTTLVPGYPAVTAALTTASEAARFDDLFGGPATVLAGTTAGLKLLVLDAPHLFARDGSPYFGPDGRPWPDNDLRFAALSATGAALAVGEGAPGPTASGKAAIGGKVAGRGFDIVHAHDWQAALAAVYLHVHDGPRPGTVLTIHNLAFQGLFPASLYPRLGLPPGLFTPAGLEFWGQVSYLKGGLVFADRLTTVSPTYGLEISHAGAGAGLDGVLRERGDVLCGILNGIDDTVWDPARDTLIPSPFSAPRLPRRAANKAALQQRMGLAPEPGTLLIGIVSRLTEQKGLDLLLEEIGPRAATGMQFVILGSGDPVMQDGFLAAAAAHPDRIGCEIGYDEALAHLIQAGADAVLMPSRFEPCGLTQLCALRYGAIPIVSRVGGLADTVIDANPAALAAGVATGIQFAPVTGPALSDALDRAETLWRDRATWTRMQRNAMKADVSWRRSAQEYATLYRALEAERA